MARTKISEWSATPSNNTDIDGINIAEGCAPSGINDAIREMMSQIKDWQAGTSGDYTAVSAGGTGVGTLTGIVKGNGTSAFSAATAGTDYVSPTGTETLTNKTLTSPILTAPVLGTPASGTLTNATGLPIATGVSGLGTGVATFLATPSSANLRSALTDETGTGSAVFATSPTLVTPVLGTPTSATLTNATGLPLTTGVTGTLPTANGGTNLTSFTSGGVVYASSSSALATGSALTFDGTNLSLSTGGLYLSYDQALYFKNLSGTNRQILAYANNTYLDGADGSIIFRTGTSPSEGFRLTSSSLYTASGINVGIGTSSPDSKLTVATTSGSTYVNIKRASQSSGEVGLNFYGGTSGVNWGIYQPVNSNNLNFYRGSDLMVLDSNGNLGLGVTPNTWSDGKAIEVGGTGNSIWGNGANSLQLMANAYYNGGYKYAGTGLASRYFQSDGVHAWLNAASGTAGNTISFTQAMTLDASGNLGVGTTSPAQKFHLNVASGSMYQQISSGSNNLYLGYDSGRTASTIQSNNALVFDVGSTYTERARIDSSGNLLIDGTATPSAGAGAYVALRGGDNTCIQTRRAGTANREQISFFNGNGQIGSITTNGTTTSYNTTSDQRLKENIQDADSASSLIDSLQVRKFDWKADGNHQRYGFVAQELVTVAPEAVHQPSDSEQMMAVDYSKLVPMLVKEIQSLRQRITTLEAR